MHWRQSVKLTCCWLLFSARDIRGRPEPLVMDINKLFTASENDFRQTVRQETALRLRFLTQVHILSLRGSCPASFILEPSNIYLALWASQFLGAHSGSDVGL